MTNKDPEEYGPLKKLAVKLIYPPAYITDEAIRQKAIFLNMAYYIMIFFSITLGMLPEIFQFGITTTQPEFIFIGSTIIIACITAIYCAKKGRIDLSTNIFLVPTLPSMFYLGTIDIDLLPFLMIPLLFVSTFQSFRNFIIILILTHIGLLFTPLYIEELTLVGVIWGIFSYILTTSTFIIFSFLFRRRLERKVHEDLVFLQTMIDTIPNPIFYINTKDLFIGCNDSFAEFVGLHKNQIIGKKLKDVTRKTSPEEYKKGNKIVLKEKKTKEYEAHLQHADGSFRNVIFYKAPFQNEKNEVSGLVGVILDISERAKIKQNLEEKVRELEKFNRLTVGRELKMSELKSRIKELEDKKEDD